MKNLCLDVVTAMCACMILSLFFDADNPPIHFEASAMAGAVSCVAIITTCRWNALFGLRFYFMDTVVFLLVYNVSFLFINSLLLRISLGLAVFHPLIGLISSFKGGVYAHAYCWSISAYSSIIISDHVMMISGRRSQPNPKHDGSNRMNDL